MKMQFGEFIFPHNPNKISVNYKNNLVINHHPFYGEKSRKLGDKLKIVRCKGVFYGDSPSTPQKQLGEFLAETKNSKSRLLFIPGIEPFLAFLENCAIDLVEDGRLMPYHLVFCQEGG